jgi:hypothetical protein
MDAEADRLQHERWQRETTSPEPSQIIGSSGEPIPVPSYGATAFPTDTVPGAVIKLEAELLELRSDLAGLDARVAGLETVVNVLADQLTRTLAIISDLKTEHALTPKIAPEVKYLYDKVSAAFEHAGLQFENIAPRSRR